MRVFFEDDDHGYDEEFDEAFVSMLRGLEKQEKSGTYILNHERVSEFAKAYQNLKKMFGDKYDVACVQRTGIGAGGWDMKVTGSDLLITKTAEFVDDIVAAADCFEVTSFLNGNVELAITFYGMVKKVGEC